ncbi:arylsulfatase precursor [Pseudohyphozyma bogoriensis]|nr:arylsulfatase precursor [Pseudohyphozyma bogoriensis]
MSSGLDPHQLAKDLGYYEDEHGVSQWDFAAAKARIGGDKFFELADQVGTGNFAIEMEHFTYFYFPSYFSAWMNQEGLGFAGSQMTLAFSLTVHAPPSWLRYFRKHPDAPANLHKALYKLMGQVYALTSSSATTEGHWSYLKDCISLVSAILLSAGSYARRYSTHEIHAALGLVIDVLNREGLVELAIVFESVGMWMNGGAKVMSGKWGTIPVVTNGTPESVFFVWRQCQVMSCKKEEGLKVCSKRRE